MSGGKRRVLDASARLASRSPSPDPGITWFVLELDGTRATTWSGPHSTRAEAEDSQRRALASGRHAIVVEHEAEGGEQ